MGNSFLKKVTLLTFITAGAIILAGFTTKRQNNQKTLSPNDQQGFAVVELFTSEGCSTCPPADQLVARIQRETVGTPVYILAFHVDYWNQAGWKDRFSSAFFTKRQLSYAESLKLSGPYTPQVIVNGSKEMIGSEESTVRQAVDASLKSIPQAELTLKDLVTKKGGISFAYTARYNAPNMFLQLALIQKKAETKVVKGENKGRTLSHIQIVRDFQTIDLKGKTDGVIQLPLSSGGQPANFEVIAFLQNNQTGEIITATRLPLGIPAGRNAN